MKTILTLMLLFFLCSESFMWPINLSRSVRSSSVLFSGKPPVKKSSNTGSRQPIAKKKQVVGGIKKKPSSSSPGTVRGGKSADLKQLGQLYGSSTPKAKGEKKKEAKPNIKPISPEKVAKKEAQRQLKESRRNESRTPPPQIRPISFSRKTIVGANIIRCRNFRLEEMKRFEFLASHKAIRTIPTYAVPEIAFIGRSNVGKSSLLNCLTGAKKHVAVQSRTPGCTQSINMFRCSDKGGELCIFVDLPGYGFAKLSKEQQNEADRYVRDYLKRRESLRVVVLLVDIRRAEDLIKPPRPAAAVALAQAMALRSAGPRKSAASNIVQHLQASSESALEQPSLLAEDLEMVEFLRTHDIPFFVVATKADKVKRRNIPDIEDKITDCLGLIHENGRIPVVGFSSITGYGKKEIWRLIKMGLLGEDESSAPAGDGVNNERSFATSAVDNSDLPDTEDDIQSSRDVEQNGH